MAGLLKVIGIIAIVAGVLAVPLGISGYYAEFAGSAGRAQGIATMSWGVSSAIAGILFLAFARVIELLETLVRQTSPPDLDRE